MLRGFLAVVCPVETCNAPVAVPCRSKWRHRLRNAHPERQRARFAEIPAVRDAIEAYDVAHQRKLALGRLLEQEGEVEA